MSDDDLTPTSAPPRLGRGRRRPTMPVVDITKADQSAALHVLRRIRDDGVDKGGTPVVERLRRPEES